MKFTILTLTFVFCLALVSAHPLPEDGLRSEALDRLLMAEADSQTALRSKRTIGILRQLFPDISQRIEEKVNSIVAEVIRVLGPVVLRNILGGGAGGGAGGGGGGNTAGVTRGEDGTSVEGKSPFDDDDEDDESTANGSKVSISLPTFPPDEEEASSFSSSTSSSITTIQSRDNIIATATTATAIPSVTTPSLSENEVTTTLWLFNQQLGKTFEDVNSESENRVNEIGSESQNNEVRVQFADEVPSDSSPQELTPLDETETDEDENRNKRFLFGFGGGAGGNAGSGNFLFDIIRLVAGSGSNQLTTSGAEHGKSDEQEAVPGPVTRFFVIANRGLSNLIQDLILRLAATSERFVNFKARLITSII